MRLLGRIFVAALLAAGFAVVPAVSASAASSVSMTWVNSYGSANVSYACKAGATYSYYGEDAARVSNGCDVRVWVNENANGSGPNYCINPGATAYGFNPSFPAGGDFESVWVSSNPAACDAGAQAGTTWYIGAGQYLEVSAFPVDCVQGTRANNQFFSGTTGSSWLDLLGLQNKCNTRIWVNKNADGTGNNICVSPGQTFDALDSPWAEWVDSDGPGESIWVSANQAPCSAG